MGDLLVLATHGCEEHFRRFHGSVAEPVARQASVNALFLREGSNGFVDPKDGEIHLRRILIPIDHKPNIVDDIFAAARDWDAALIAMSTAGHQGFLDALRGSTCERVLCHASCPAFVVPTS